MTFPLLGRLTIREDSRKVKAVSEFMAQDGSGAAGVRVSSTVDDAALIRAVQHGERDAFEQLVSAYDQSVLRLAMNLLRSAEDARDVISGGFLACLPEHSHVPVRLQFSHVAVPDRDERLPGPSAQTQGAKRGAAIGAIPLMDLWTVWRFSRRSPLTRSRTGRVEPAVEKPD